MSVRPSVCVHGLWHLGSVTAACLAEAGFPVIGLDDDAAAVAGLSEGRPPLFEPGLPELTAAGLAAGTLSFTTDPVRAVAGADVVWVAFDTPVDDEDRADVAFVAGRVRALFPHLKDGAVVLVSSQMPAGSVAALEQAFAVQAGGRTVSFACSPENLRLGKAIEVFKHPERIVIGVRDARTRAVLTPLLAPFCDTLMWVSVESAEMTKHAVNAFLATCVTFINEVASVCEQVGADAAEVEAALRAEPRIGPRAYIRPGAAFAGGTLARDVAFLTAMGKDHALSLPLLGGILPSNQAHRGWALRRLDETLGGLNGRRVAVLGLSYKPGTDALRRSVAVELCRGLLAAGAEVSAFDPAVRSVPDDLAAVRLAPDVQTALEGAEALVLATEWPDFRALTPEGVAAVMAGPRPLVVDANRFLPAAFAADPRLTFITIGKPL